MDTERGRTDTISKNYFSLFLSVSSASFFHLSLSLYLSLSPFSFHSRFSLPISVILVTQDGVPQLFIPLPSTDLPGDPIILQTPRQFVTVDGNQAPF